MSSTSAMRPILQALVFSCAVATIVGSPARAGPGEAAGPRRERPSPTNAPAHHHADFVVLVWYRLSDPLGTFAYQVYDVRKGEHTSKVDEWADMVRSRYPNYYVALREVNLNDGPKTAPERGTVPFRSEDLAKSGQSPAVSGQPRRQERERSEKLKVGAVIHRELMVAAARSGIVVGAPGPFARASRPGPFDISRERPARNLGPMPVQNDRSYLFRNRGYGFPVPMPYVRPHP